MWLSQTISLPISFLTSLVCCLLPYRVSDLCPLLKTAQKRFRPGLTGVMTVVGPIFGTVVQRFSPERSQKWLNKRRSKDFSLAQIKWSNRKSRGNIGCPTQAQRTSAVEHLDEHCIP
jgi:hypothetical protein